MPPKNTERRNAAADGLDVRAPIEVLSAVHDVQLLAAACVKSALPQIAEAAAQAARVVSSGGYLAYVAAGSSGLMALADALELPGTFGIAQDKIRILLAGGSNSLADLSGWTEDDTGQAEADIAAAGLGAGDCAICLSASGTTPYSVAALKAAKANGALTVGIANNARTEMFERADIAILLKTPPEIVAGSTRMGAGTAQKIALNMLSTLMAVHLGHIYDGYMVNVRADNDKLKDRARRMVADICGIDMAAAQSHLQHADGSVKVAVLLAAGAENTETAHRLLKENGQKLRPALSDLTGADALQQQ